MSRDLFSIEAEHALLGALMLDASLYDDITSNLTTQDFSDLENAALYQSICNTHAAGYSVDPVTRSAQPRTPPPVATLFRSASASAAGVARSSLPPLRHKTRPRADSAYRPPPGGFLLPGGKHGPDRSPGHHWRKGWREQTEDARRGP
ncbi:TPA: hypothetical protein QEM50_001047 [Pseudomonas putida]|nr:hypothetical protein [Pseudomonas putida]